MEIVPRLVTAMLLPSQIQGPLVPGPPDRRLVIVRTDTELTVYDLDRPTTGDNAPVVSFPAPWPRDAGGVDAVAPGLDVAVFAGLHAARAVEPDGLTRWEIPHACWACGDFHESAGDYAGDADHRYPGHGSVGFGVGARTVWAHVRGPLAGDDGSKAIGGSGAEAWLMIDVSDGTVTGRAATATYAAGSHHIPHPDPAVMGLSVGEGQDGSPALWGRWQDGELRIARLAGDDEVLVAAGPAGRTFLTVGHSRCHELTVHDTADHTVVGTLFADMLPPTDASACWDLHQYGLVDDRTLVASTSYYGHGETGIRHWLIDVDALEVLGQVRYPMEVSSGPLGWGDGTWLTTGPTPNDLSVWRLPS
ncbi:hypothetical protein ABZS66_15355 [Dactylosporangium sp. NPDC005572]|uniref:hypothetical protein n=1 Tax=Dactylosporangium sp. NPDC005572 TaxID=3156889 RepID=UPI0033ADD42D